jgi:hypothetical protein
MHFVLRIRTLFGHCWHLPAHKLLSPFGEFEWHDVV